jgi:hypothetical protein
VHELLQRSVACPPHPHVTAGGVFHLVDDAEAVTGPFGQGEQDEKRRTGRPVSRVGILKYRRSIYRLLILDVGSSFNVQVRRTRRKIWLSKESSVASSSWSVFRGGRRRSAGACGRPARPTAGRLPSIADRTAGFQKIDGFFRSTEDASGTLLLEIPRLNVEVLYRRTRGRAGVERHRSDRAQLGVTRIVKFEKLGPRS